MRDVSSFSGEKSSTRVITTDKSSLEPCVYTRISDYRYVMSEMYYVRSESNKHYEIIFTIIICLYKHCDTNPHCVHVDNVPT